MPDKKGDTRLANRFSSATQSAVVGRFLDLVEKEIEAGASAAQPSFAGVNHLNDILHTAGLITNDCWNNVKGTTKANNFIAVSTPVLKTLVKGGTDIAKGALKRREDDEGYSESDVRALASLLGAVEAADVKGDIEG